MLTTVTLTNPITMWPHFLQLVLSVPLQELHLVNPSLSPVSSVLIRDPPLESMMSFMHSGLLLKCTLYDSFLVSS